MSHTSGPWSWANGQREEYLPILMGNGLLATVCDFGVDEEYYPTAGKPPNDDDMRLIAAAPDLYEALRAITDQLPDFPDPKTPLDVGLALTRHSITVRLVRNAQAALKKAEPKKDEG